MPNTVQDATQWVSTTVAELATDPPAALRLRASGLGTLGRWDWPAVGGPHSLAYRAESRLVDALRSAGPGRVRVYLDALGDNGRPSKRHPQRTKVVHMTNKNDQQVEVTGALRAGTLAAKATAELATLDATGSTSPTEMAAYAIAQESSLRLMLGTMRHGLAVMETEHETVRDLTRTVLQSRSLDLTMLQQSWEKVGKAEAEVSQLRHKLAEEAGRYNELHAQLLQLQSGAPEMAHSQLLAGINGVINNARGAVREVAGLHAVKARREAQAQAVAEAAEGAAQGVEALPPMVAQLMGGLFRGEVAPELAAPLILQGAPDDVRTILVELASHIVMLSSRGPSGDGEGGSS